MSLDGGKSAYMTVAQAGDDSLERAVFQLPQGSGGQNKNTPGPVTVSLGHNGFFSRLTKEDGFLGLDVETAAGQALIRVGHWFLLLAQKYVRR
jgi:hypothetical protein